MNFSASSYYTLHRPSFCDRRVYLRSHKIKEPESSEFDKLLEELGQRHELEHLSTFEEFEDLRGASFEDRISRTLPAVKNGASVIYQGVLQSTIPGSKDEVVGIPDFLIKDGKSYRIRDCKLARHADESRHPEILLQLELYGWLFEETFEMRPTALEAYLGDRTILETSYDGGAFALEVLKDIRSVSNLKEEPYSPVGWSKCMGCGFEQRCWSIAHESGDPAIIPAIDQGAANGLRKIGIQSIDHLLKKFDVAKLAEFKRPWGKGVAKIGKSSERILLQAEAIRDNKEILISPIGLPDSENMVMFDLEGMPPFFDELDKVYLWGIQVYGAKPGPFTPALASFGTEGDRQGWMDFLSNSRKIFADHGDIPFVHWANYEKTKLKAYMKRFGDEEEIAQRVLANCLDLLEVTKESLILPVYSYGLKMVEKYVKFKRTMEEFGGEWSMAQYIRAVETKDEKLRNEIMSKIVKYNEEDLQATWAVLQWLRERA